MNPRLLRILLPLVVVVLGALAARAIIASRPEPVRQQAPESLPLVAVIAAERVDHQYQVTAQGTVEPRTSSSLVAEVAGRVLRVSENFVEGGFFEKDEVLLVLDDRDYQAAVAQASARVASTEYLLEREKEEARLAREEWERFSTGGEPTALVLREPQLAQARAELDAARAQLERAERDLARTRVRAPYAGRVRSKQVDVGDFAQPGARAAQIYAVDYAEVRLPLPDQEIAYLDLPLGLRGGRAANERGPRVELRGRFAGSVHVWEGYVHRTEGEIDPRTRMVHVVVRVPDPYGRAVSEGGVPLSVGMFVEALIEGRQVQQVFVLPRQTLLEGNRVAVVDDHDRLRIRPVEVLRATHQQAVIASGVESGDRVLRNRIDVMVEGMGVRVAGGTRPEVAESSPADGGAR